MGVGKEAKVGVKSAAINCHRYISKIGRSSSSVPKRSRERLGWLRLHSDLAFFESCGKIKVAYRGTPVPKSGIIYGFINF